VNRTIVALHAHPDDEASKGAATVARYSDAGVRAVLVCATGGEAGDVLNPAMDRPEVHERLADVRRAELLEAARIIGYHEVVELGFRDSGMPGSEHNGHPKAFCNVPFDEALEAVVGVIRRERPQLLFGYDEHRFYQHPDHLRIRDLGVAAFTAAADPERFPESGDPWEVAKLYAPVFAVTRIRVLHEAMLERGLESPFHGWLDRLQEGEADYSAAIMSRIEIGATLERARSALRAHRTQVDPDGFWFQIPAEVIREVYPFEDFELLATRVPVTGPEDDLFSGI
jgi:mycothiol S-conjugate amidase